MKTNKLKTAFLILTAMAVLLSAPALPVSAESTDSAAIDVTALYKKKDIEDTWSPDEAESIDLNTLADGETLTVSRKGDYVLTGTLNGQVLIEAPEDPEKSAE